MIINSLNNFQYEHLVLCPIDVTNSGTAWMQVSIKIMFPFFYYLNTFLTKRTVLLN